MRKCAWRLPHTAPAAFCVCLVQMCGAVGRKWPALQQQPFHTNAKREVLHAISLCPPALCM